MKKKNDIRHIFVIVVLIILLIISLSGIHLTEPFSRFLLLIAVVASVLVVKISKKK